MVIVELCDLMGKAIVSVACLYLECFVILELQTLPKIQRALPVQDLFLFSLMAVFFPLGISLTCALRVSSVPSCPSPGDGFGAAILPLW